MDAFYAAVEQRDNPELKGKPVIVGGDPDSRGVVSTCSYEARKYGIHSAMPCKTAHRLCPQGIFVRPQMSKYVEASKQIREIFFRFTDLVEPLSLDEAYLDVTENKINEPYATKIAVEIKKTILKEIQLTASAGVGPGKFIAKVASEINKPNGLTVITPDKVEAFLEVLPIEKFFGVGKVTVKKMHANSIYNGNDLKQKSLEELSHLFGKHGVFYYHIVRGNDNREVSPNRVRKSISVEHTYSIDSNDKEELLVKLNKLVDDLFGRMSRAKCLGKTLNLKIKFADFKIITRSFSPGHFFQEKADILSSAEKLLIQSLNDQKVRLLGIGVSNLDNEDDKDIKDEEQLSFQIE